MNTKMCLAVVQDTVRQVAEAIATVLKIDVTIVDNNRRRIAATGQYKDRVDTYIASDSAFSKALMGKALPVTDTCHSTSCQNCSGRETCPELAHLCQPILVRDRVVGVISLLAFTEQQRRDMLDCQEHLENFIGKMANLIADTLVAEEAMQKLDVQKQQLEAIVNSVSEGIVAVDGKGYVSFCNQNAEKLLEKRYTEIVGGRLEEILPDNNLLNILQSGQPATITIVYSVAQQKQVYLLAAVTPISDNLGLFGAVITLRSIREVYEMATTVTAKYAFCSFDSIIGSSPAMKEVIDVACRAARLDSTILVQGESGTGKELIARAIHRESPRRDKPFVAINCGAIPDNLLESELFGYESGAFTGSRTGGKPGKLEMADGGTVFLDEIGDMPVTLQVKLLRFLQDNCLERLGGTKPKRLNIRVIAATNRDLETLMKQGAFREDLYYRLSVVPIDIPPLRKRAEEIPVLIHSFLNRYCQMYGKHIEKVLPEAQAILAEYSWPGNIRELENCLEYAVNMVDGTEIAVGHLPKRILRSQKENGVGDGLVPLEELEKRMLALAWQMYGDHEEATLLIAQQLKISRATVYRKLKKYNIIS